MIGQRLVAGVVLATVFSLGALSGVFYDRHISGPRLTELSNLICRKLTAWGYGLPNWGAKAFPDKW